MSKRRLSLEPGKRVFLLSCIDKDPRKNLCSMIKQLNGTVLVSQDFRCDCTHVIIGKLSRGEKFLGALASGKWVVHPDYICDSHRAGDFLDEEQYEWCGDRILGKYEVNEEMAFASRRWRFMLGAAFSGWKVAVVAGHERATIMKRLLHAGGAELFNIPLPLKKPEKIADMVTYVFVSEAHKGAVAPLVDYGVLCLKPEYISDYLIKDPVPDVMEYVVTVDNTNTAVQEHTPNQSEDDIIEQYYILATQIEDFEYLQDVKRELTNEGELSYSDRQISVASRDSFYKAQTTAVDGPEESLNVTENKSKNLLEKERSPLRQSSETVEEKVEVKSYFPDFEETSVVGKKGKSLIKNNNSMQRERKFSDISKQNFTDKIDDMDIPGSSVSDHHVGLIENSFDRHSFDDNVNLQTKPTESVQQTVNGTSSVIELETSVGHFKAFKNVESTGTCGDLNVSELVRITRNTRTECSLYHKNVVEESQTPKTHVPNQCEDHAGGNVCNIFEISKQLTECSDNEYPNRVIKENFKLESVKKQDIEQEKQDNKGEVHNSGKDKHEIEMNLLGRSKDISTATDETEEIINREKESPSSSQTPKRSPLQINKSAIIKLKELIDKSPKKHSVAIESKTGHSRVNVSEESYDCIIDQSAIIKLNELIEKSPKKHLVHSASETGQGSDTNCNVHVSKTSNNCTVGKDTDKNIKISDEKVSAGKIDEMHEGRNACIMSENDYLVVNRSTEVNSIGKNKKEENSVGKNKTEENIVGKNKTEENSFGENKTEENSVDKNRTEENSVGKNKTEVDSLSKPDINKLATSDSGVCFEDSNNQGKQNQSKMETSLLKVTQDLSKDSAKKQKSITETNRHQTLSKGKNSTGVPITNFFKPVEKKMEEFWMSCDAVKSEFYNTFRDERDNASVIAEDFSSETLVNSSLNIGEEISVISKSTDECNKTVLSEARTVPILAEMSVDCNCENYSLPCSDSLQSEFGLPDGKSISSDDTLLEKPQQSNNMTHRQLRKRHFVSTVTDSDRPDFTPRRKSMGSYEKLSKHTQQGNQSREFHNLWSDIILMIIEDEFYHCSLTELSNALSYQDYPQAEILLQVMDVVLFKTNSELESNLALSVLDNVLTLHPPVTVAMQRLYLEALVDQESKKSNLPVSYEWAFIRDVISGSLLGDELFRRKNVGLLRFLTKLLKTNVDHFTPSSLNDQPPKHMLFKIFWPTSFVTFNSLCRELFDFVQEILEVLGTCHTASERICLRQVLQEVLLLVAMVTETCRRDEKVTGLKAMSAERTREFIIQLENRTRGRCNTDTFLFVSSRLLFPWLQVCFCKQVLDIHTLYNDYLVADRPEKKFDLSVIVTHYIYLLPTMIQDVGNAVQPKASTSQSSSIADKIPNKRQMAKNSKGESKLMRACIRNDIEKVRELLATPGVDVNATDHAGWTALHEAAFHGHVDCIRELLKYVPVKSAATGGHGTNALQKVDLLAVNDEGITPLHDAARKNKVEACRLLLQHGGTKLLRALNIWKQTPLQIAQSNQSYEVVSLLETYQGDEMNRVSIRPEKSAEAIYKGTDPFETRYEEALCVDGRRIYADKCSTLLYIQVVTELIVAKICLTNELSRTHRTVNQCKQCQQRRESLSEISNGNKLTDVDKNKNHVMQDTVPPQTDQQRCETSYVSDVRNLSSEDSILLENGTSTSDSQMQETCDMDHFDVTHLDMYVERFRRHLLRISHPEDTRLIEESLFELKMFSESLR